MVGTVMDKPNWPSRYRVNDNWWTKKDVTGNGLTAYYVCPHKRRSLCPCAATMTRKYVVSTGKFYEQENKPHTCQQMMLSNDVMDISGIQKIYIEDNIQLFANSGMSMQKVAREVNTHFATLYKDKAVKSMDIRQVYAYLIKQRANEQGSDWKSRILSHPLGSLDPTGTSLCHLILALICHSSYIPLTSDYLTHLLHANRQIR
jgi:hypothetical protein